jgi:glutamate synthase (NADPH/NADH) small chain
MADTLKKVNMPHQDAKVRKNNFEEVALGYNSEMAIAESKRCLTCKNKPCISGCPVNVKIPDFISHIQKGEFEEAYQVIKETNALPAVCGRVCPQESQCECKCVRGLKGEPVAIGRLERFAADYHIEHNIKEENTVSHKGDKVAVIGAGPAGLTCAGELAKKGYNVTVFEALHNPGGVLIYGIPEFRLPKRIVKSEIEELKKSGVEIKTNMIIGKTISVDELLKQDFKTVFIGSGAGLPSFMGIEGENLNGVYSANEYLTRTNLMKAYSVDYDTPIKHSRNVAVIGGGNVAMDAARCALRLGSENVYIVYRRSIEEMPARKEEIDHAKEEGVTFKLLNSPVRFVGDEKGCLTSMVCTLMELGEPDDSGRRHSTPIEDSEFLLDVDTVIIAVGTSPNPLIRKTTSGLDINRRGCIVANDGTGLTSREGVYAGGDTVTGAATVILAMGAGKKAAIAMDEYMNSH